jgi:hypothetical protein
MRPSVSVEKSTFTQTGKILKPIYGVAAVDLNINVAVLVPVFF